MSTVDLDGLLSTLVNNLELESTNAHDLTITLIAVLKAAQDIKKSSISRLNESLLTWVSPTSTTLSILNLSSLGKRETMAALERREGDLNEKITISNNRIKELLEQIASVSNKIRSKGRCKVNLHQQAPDIITSSSCCQGCVQSSFIIKALQDREIILMRQLEASNSILKQLSEVSMQKNNIVHSSIPENKNSSEYCMFLETLHHQIYNIINHNDYRYSRKCCILSSRQ